jgi:Phage-related lysozyme (muraminidase)
MASPKNAAGAAVFVACVSLCAGFEGLSTTAYEDKLAYNIPTVCYGETEGVKLSDRYTPAECKQMLAKKLPRYWDEINPCIKVRVTNNQIVAFTDFAYNVGSGGFCKSSLLKKLNAGDYVGACNGLMAWDMAGGVHVRGLARRRAAERDWCLRPDALPKPETPNVVLVAPKPASAFPSDLSPTVAVVPEPAQTLVCRGWWFWKKCS